MGIFFLGCCCWETGACWNIYCSSNQGDAWELLGTCTIVHAVILLVFPYTHCTTGAIFKNEINLADWLSAHMDKHVCTSGWKSLLYTTVNRLGASCELVRHFKMFASSPVDGANAPLCRFLSFTVFCICGWEIFRYAVKNLFRMFWVCATLTYQWLRKKPFDHRHNTSI